MAYEKERRASEAKNVANAKADAKYVNPKMSKDINVDEKAPLKGKPLNRKSAQKNVDESKAASHYENMSASTTDAAVAKMQKLTCDAEHKVNKKNKKNFPG